MKGYVHSIETCGTVDGPGLRYVIFLQGCPMRCQYCHNPDTWKIGAGKEMTEREVLKGFFNNMAFYKSGGVTVTGGEPLLQIDFLIALFTLLKKHKVHTCIDTSGVTFNPRHGESLEKLDQLLALTDLIMLDLKHIDPDKHKILTGHSNKNILAFARHLEARQIPLWIRHVVIPGITYQEDDLFKLGLAIGSLKNVKALDVLPYHSMGNSKYEQLGMTYPLADTLDLPKEDAIKAKNIILRGIRQQRLQNK